MLRELIVLVLALSLCSEVAQSSPARSNLLTRRLQLLNMREKAREQKDASNDTDHHQFVEKLRQTSISNKSLAEVIHYLLNPSAGPILNHPINIGVLRKILAGNKSSDLSLRQKSFKQ